MWKPLLYDCLWSLEQQVSEMCLCNFEKKTVVFFLPRALHRASPFLQDWVASHYPLLKPSRTELQKAAMLLSPTGFNPIKMHRTTNESCSRPNIMAWAIGLMNKCRCSPMFKTGVVRDLTLNCFQTSALDKNATSLLLPFMWNKLATRLEAMPRKLWEERDEIFPQNCVGKMEDLLVQADRKRSQKNPK